MSQLPAGQIPKWHHLGRQNPRALCDALTERVKEMPDDREATSDLALLLCYMQAEREAFTLFERSRGGQSFGMLAQVIHEYALANSIPDWVEATRPHLIREPQKVGTTVTACLIVKNEERNLARCLRSLKGAVDEIVVVDTGSDDSTVSIAESFGAKVGHFTWISDFAAARNASLDLATGDWVLWIDADEELAPGCQSALRQGTTRPQFGGYSIEIRNFLEEGDGKQVFLHFPTRLFRRHPAIRFEGRIHEQINPSIHALGLPVARIEGAVILHHGYRPSEFSAKGKAERNLEMLRREVLENPNDAFQWFNLANGLAIEQDFAAAEHAAQKATRLVPPGADYGAIAYQILAMSRTALGHFEQALKTCDEADRAGFGGAYNEFERTAAYLALDRLEDALASIQKCLTYVRPAGTTGDESVYTLKRHIVHAQVLARMERFSEARTALQPAIEADRQFPLLRLTLARMAEAEGDWETALAETDGLETLEAGLLVRARALKGLGRIREACRTAEQAFLLKGTSVEIWGQWHAYTEASLEDEELVRVYQAYSTAFGGSCELLTNWGRALIRLGQLPEALGLLSEAVDADPDNTNARFNLGDLLYRLGRYTESALHYQQAVRAQPHHAEGWFVLGNALAQMNLIAEAQGCYRSALDLSPGHPKALHNLKALAA